MTAERSQKDKGAGRPASVTKEGKRSDFSPDVMQKLEQAFNQGLNNTEACLFANISERSFYDVLSKNEPMKERFKLLQENTKMRAKQNIYNEINKGDKDTSKWYLERKSDEFKPKSSTDVTSGGKTIDGFNFQMNNENDTNDKADNKTRKSVE